MNIKYCKSLIINLVLLINLVNCDTDEFKLQKTYLELSKNLNSFFTNFNSLEYINNFITKNNSSSLNTSLNTKSDDNLNYNSIECLAQLGYFTSELDSSAIWALTMFDSWGKMPSGIFSGNVYSFGNFDQCVKFSFNTNVENIGEINGQYCLATIAPLVNDPDVKTVEQQIRMTNAGQRMAPGEGAPLSIGIGICLPRTCSPEFIKNEMNAVLKPFNMKIATDNFETKCSSNAPMGYSSMDIFAIAFFSIIFALLLSSTMYDFTTKYISKPQNPLFLAFSVLTNGKKILACKNSKSPDVMNCLNGIRVLSLVWVVFGHTYLMFMFAGSINLVYLVDWSQQWFSLLLLSATVSVDSFFLLSGLLVTWSVLKELKKSNRLNVPVMFIHRYLRLTPALAALMLYSVTLLKFSGSGPLFKSNIDMMFNQCDKWWWSLLFYVQNYVNPNAICLGHSWYLSVDMQLFILAPLILYPLWKFGKKFIGVFPVLILLAMGCAFTTYYINDFASNPDKSLDKMRLTYYPTHIRMHAWLVGAILGYILHNLREKQINLPKILVVSGWIISLVTILAVIFGQKELINFENTPKNIDMSFYESFSRVAWAIALAWIIFACVKGYGGYINTFLSSPYWLPLARLSYSMYLLHFVIQILYTGSIKTNVSFSNINSFFNFWGYFGLTLSLSLIWCLAFESPIVILEKYLFGRAKAQTKPKIETNSHNKDPLPTSSTVNLIIEDEREKY